MRSGGISKYKRKASSSQDLRVMSSWQNQDRARHELGEQVGIHVVLMDTVGVDHNHVCMYVFGNIACHTNISMLGQAQCRSELKSAHRCILMDLKSSA